MNRREFLQTSAAGLAVAAAQPVQAEGGGPPVVISSGNGLRATEKAMEMIRQGADTLEAVVAGVNIVEADPEDTSVGYGGLPNEEGVVQLDSSVMHGPTGGAGAVACLQDIVYPSKVAKLVMERTDHVLLVGEGALRFAVAMGFERQNLLTPRARQRWIEWKTNLSSEDDWIDPSERIAKPGGQAGMRRHDRLFEHHGTINCCAVDEKGDLSGVTTTSGLAFKVPGRVGDSPIIGAGLYVDNEVGACGSTGRGEANLKSCASFLAVELMRGGDSPEEAGLKVLRRIAGATREPYLLDDEGRPKFQLIFYLLNKKGEFAGTAMRSGPKYAVHDGRGNRLTEVAYLYKSPERKG